MKRLSLLLFILVGFVFNANAQHDPNDQIMSVNWDIIGSVDFKTVKETEMYAIFNNEIKNSKSCKIKLQNC